MEDPEFIKCEPANLSDIQDTSNSGPNVVKMKMEPDCIFPDQTVQEEISNAEHEMKNEVDCEEYCIGGIPVDEYFNKPAESLVTTSGDAEESRGTSDKEFQENNRKDSVVHKNVNCNCHVCRVTSSTKSGYIEHVHTPGEKYSVVKSRHRSVMCNICKKIFTRRYLLKRHMMAHYGDGSIICSLCQKSYSRQSYLNTHMLTHTGCKVYSCETCGKSIQRSNLNRHTLRHSEQHKSSVCDVCNKGFAERSNLERHSLTHKIHKSFICDLCGNNFSRRDHLISHISVHTVHKEPHVCETCGKAFVSRSSLNRHMSLHTGKMRYPCQKCRRAFWQKSRLEAHVLVHLTPEELAL